MEYFETAFPEKLKALKKAYKIKSIDLIDYCKLFTQDYMSRHAVTLWENKKSDTFSRFTVDLERKNYQFLPVYCLFENQHSARQTRSTVF